MSEEDLILQHPETPPETELPGLVGLIRRHPGLAVAGGLALGLAAAALVPGGTRRKLVRRSAAAAGAAGEAGLKLGKQGAARLDRLGETIGENTVDARRRASEAAGHARDTGIDWAKAAIGLLAALRR